MRAGDDSRVSVGVEDDDDDEEEEVVVDQAEGYSTEDSAISSDHLSRHPSSDSLVTDDHQPSSGKTFFFSHPILFFYLKV